MNMIKDTRWRVRGDLEFNKRTTIQGRHYRLVDTKSYETAQGGAGELPVWTGTCVVCGSEFTFETARSRFYPTARCQEHRPIIRGRGHD